MCNKKTKGPNIDFFSPVKWLTEFIERLVKGRSEFDKRVAPLVILVKDIHCELLALGKLNHDKLEQQIKEFEMSTDAIWLKDSHYNARVDFLRYARYALNVLSKYGQYRNEIERSETERFLTDAKNRLMAIFKKKKVPPAFNPYGVV